MTCNFLIYNYHTIPNPLVFTDDISVMIAILNETLPLLIPPNILAIMNIAKFVENDHNKFDISIPV